MPEKYCYILLLIKIKGVAKDDQSQCVSVYLADAVGVELISSLTSGNQKALMARYFGGA